MANFCLKTLDYQTDLTAYYQQLVDLPGFVLLESSDRLRGRYDIVTAYPYRESRLDNPATREQAQDWLSQLNGITDIPSENLPCDLPFQGGAIGFFSYELGYLLTPTAFAATPSLLPLGSLNWYDWAIITDHWLKKTWLFAANRQAQTAEIILEVTARWHQQSRAHHSFQLIEPVRPLIDKSHYQHAFSAIKDALFRGHCYQVNYTQPFRGRYQGCCWTMYNQIKRQNPVPYGAFLRLPEADIISFSPERFLSMYHRQILTSPIKGTMRRAQDEAEDELLKQTLQACLKNKAENVMIVDLMRNDLSKIAKPGSVKVRALCSIESYQAVHHLVSHIEAFIPSTINQAAIWQACFPGGSITGAPKLAAMQVIAEQELTSRGVYCGSLAYFSHHGQLDSSIAIRTMTAMQNQLHMAAGGGIVMDSVMEEEYEECFIKIAAILRGLSL